jgi:hypothetical protein
LPSRAKVWFQSPPFALKVCTNFTRPSCKRHQGSEATNARQKASVQPKQAKRKHSYLPHAETLLREAATPVATNNQQRKPS